MSEKTRRIVAIFLALALAVGLTAHGARTAAMDVEMAATMTSDMGMPDKCDACGDGKGSMSLGTCAAYCSMAALPSVVMTSLEASPALVPTPEASPSMVGHGPPPDPYPPKLVALI